jgi:hypothetical protein
MNRNLELLPNEILIKIFEYIDARELYRGFYNLNSRLNQLIRSSNRLSLTLSQSDRNENIDYEIISSQIYTLIVNQGAGVILAHFTNVRRLILFWLPDNVLDKLLVDILPHLKLLHISSRSLTSVCWRIDFYDKIFTNGFPQLKFCSLADMDIKKDYLESSHTPALTVLKLGSVNLFIYKIILSSCPNLHFFQLSIVRSERIPNRIEHHMNIKNLVLKPVCPSMILNTGVINMYLSCVPNLERLSIHLIRHVISNFPQFCRSDWLARIIDLHLSKLHQVDYYVSVLLNRTTTEYYNENLLHRLQENFEHVHKKHYQSRLIINQENIEDFVDLLMMMIKIHFFFYL